MIDTKDLMLGNWVQVIRPDINGKFVLIESISDDRINMDFRPFNIPELKPIPLTEDILVNNCGFEKLPETEYTINTYELHRIRVWVNNGRFLLLSKYPIDYLHELQQAVKLLTKQELEVKL